MVALFELGVVVATPSSLELLAIAAVDPIALLARHQHGDWGDVPPEDVCENELSVREGLRILSAYTLLGGRRVWVLTEADRSATMILTPEEY